MQNTRQQTSQSGDRKPTASVKKLEIEATFNDGRFAVILMLGGIRMTALLDTGVSCSVMKASFFQKVCQANHRSSFFHTTGYLQSVTGQEMTMLGKVIVLINQIQNMADLIVLPDSVIWNDMVLGLDLLTGVDAKIDCSAETLSCFGKILLLRRLDG